MKKFVTFYTFTALACLFSLNVFSQSSFVAHVGPAIPIGKFANDDSNAEETGGAALGINLGIELKHKTAVKGLSLFAGVDYINNGLTNRLKESLEESITEVTHIRYSNIPVIGGFYLASKSQNNFSVFGCAGIGVDYLLVSDMRFKANSYHFKITIDPSTAFAFKIGAGFILSEKYVIGVNYLSLGEHKMVSTLSDETQKITASDNLNISLITATFGVKF
jgi:hypothetical protein